jgi:Mg-chelatase subunit ChlD
MNTPTQRKIVALLSMQLMLSACSATAHPFADQAPANWPQPRPAQWPQAKPVSWPAPAKVNVRPNFEAPSATSCARPIETREIPGQPVAQSRPSYGSYDARDEDRRKADKSPAEREAAAPAAPSALAKAAPATIPAAAARESSRAIGAAGAMADMRSDAPAPTASPHWAQPSPAPVPEPVQSQRPRMEAVTAGMVDDNADFSSYLAFRNRTRVEHRARDIRERYLLEVKDARGRGVADAEVAVQSPRGYAMWARTDTAGHVWLHPDAFDPSHAAVYDVAVRKDGRQAQGYLKRGQKSSVEVVLNARNAAVRAKLDLVFLIDATGSMDDEIAKLKSTVNTIAADVAQLPSRPDLCFGLVAYRDKHDQFLVRSHDLTNDLGAFQGVLNALQAAGGGDYPEAMNEALNETVHRISWRGDGATRLVVLIADAPPHLDYGGPQYDDDMMAALGKGIKIFSVGASGLDKQGEYIQRQMAQYTGGKFVFLTYDQARNPASGPGRETVHDVKNYSVDTLDRLIVRLVSDELGKLARAE